MKHEDHLQIACMDYVRWKHPDILAIHIPNGGSRNVIEAKKLKRMGVTAGVPDIFIPCKGKMKISSSKSLSLDSSYLDDFEKMAIEEASKIFPGDISLKANGFFCELKVGKNKPSKLQLEMHQKLTHLGYYVCVCYTLDEFIKEVEWYLGTKKADDSVSIHPDHNGDNKCSQSS